MDSNSSFPETTLKIEEDVDNRTVSHKIERLNWTSRNIMKLLETLEKNCKELWDEKHPLYKAKTARAHKYEYLADLFGTTTEEIQRKIHNLRTQFNNERRKIKRRSETAGGGSRWEYFDAMSFLSRQQETSETELNGVDEMPLELALADFQEDDEDEYETPAKRVTNHREKKPKVEVSFTPPVASSLDPLLWTDDSSRLRPSLNPDEHQIFGDFVASELRTLRSHESQRKLKRMIQRAILQIGEEDDEIMSKRRPSYT